MWVSGLGTVCASCKRALGPGSDEVADLLDDVIVGAQTCASCGTQHLYTRRPTAAEQKCIRRHQDKIVNIERRQQIPLAELFNRDEPRLF